MIIESMNNIELSFFFSFIHFLFSCGLSTHNKHDDDDDDYNQNLLPAYNIDRSLMLLFRCPFAI